jgi:hypothetical protein
MPAYLIEINSTDESTFRAADNSSADTLYEVQEASHRTETACVFVVCGTADTVLIDNCCRRFGEYYCLHPQGILQIN